MPAEKVGVLESVPSRFSAETRQCGLGDVSFRSGQAVNPQVRVCLDCSARRFSLFGVLDEAALQQMHYRIADITLEPGQYLYAAGVRGAAGCAVDGTGRETSDITDVNHTAVERQSIGNCWIYATTGWVESLILQHAQGSGRNEGALLGELHRRPVDEHCAQFVLEARHVGADIGLHGVQGARGGREASVIANGDQRS